MGAKGPKAVAPLAYVSRQSRTVANSCFFFDAAKQNQKSGRSCSASLFKKFSSEGKSKSNLVDGGVCWSRSNSRTTRAVRASATCEFTAVANCAIAVSSPGEGPCNPESHCQNGFL
jgi:hypothetical protein